MSKKTFVLVSIIVSAVCAIGVGVVDFLSPFKWSAAIAASIPIVEGAVIGICTNFVEPTVGKK